MKIIYVHHGNRLLGNPPTQDDDLTELGYEDCKLVAQLLNNKRVKSSVKAIYTSTFFRCTKTAEIINTNLNVDIIGDDRLNEAGSFKDETWVDVQKRIIACLDDIIQKYNDNDTVICVTSGVNIGAFICKAYNIEPSEQTPYLMVPSCSPIGFEYHSK